MPVFTLNSLTIIGNKAKIHENDVITIDKQKDNCILKYMQHFYQSGCKKINTYHISKKKNRENFKRMNVNSKGYPYFSLSKEHKLA